jgi:AraC family transcriptional regulator
MSPTVVLIKNMVCQRCIMTVEGILNKIAIPFQKVTFGEVYIQQPLTDKQKEVLRTELELVGFELIDNHTTEIIEKAKQLIIKKARNEDDTKEVKLNLSKFLSDNLNYEYTHISSMFSAIEGRTIEQYFIEQRIEKAKELLVYGQLTLSEIAYELNYSSVAHLSGQFKKITGLTPSYYKEVGAAKRKALDKV